MERQRETSVGAESVPGVGGRAAEGLQSRASEVARPRFVLENHEDEVYHETRLTGFSCATDPEYLAFMDQYWVFNRAMRWVEGPGGTLLCYSDGGDLWLTGNDGVSEWFSDPVNEITHDSNGRHCFVRRSNRRRDCVVLPAFQFNIKRHSKIRLEVSEATTDWQFCVLIKGRSGPPILSSQWCNGQATLTFDIRDALRERGFELHFAELFFVIGMWSRQPEREDKVRFSLQLCAASAVVPCLPVIRTRQSAQADGVPVSALVLDEKGSRLGKGRASLAAQVGGNSFELEEKDGLWFGRIPSLPEGDHEVRLSAQGEIMAETSLAVRVTDGEFLSYDALGGSLARRGIPTGPLSGSYDGSVYFRDVGQPSEAIVQGQAEFDAWDRHVPPGEHWHYWEALTEEELDTRFRFLAENGWHLLHLCQHWGVWEKLDAAGRIAPHGAEQVALYYRVASRNGLSVVQALSHYPYGQTKDLHGQMTPPYRQYVEAGLQNENWTDVGSKFTERFHGYLNDFVSLFRDETAIAFLTTSGEGDIAAGPNRVNDTCRFVKALDPNHLFLSEPIHKMSQLPHEHYRGYDQPLFAARLYWIGIEFEPEIDLGVDLKLMQLGPVFVGEGSWPCPHLYSKFMGHNRTWAGTPEYRTRVRDTLYLALVHRIPIILTWGEGCTEDEHRVLDIIRSQVDWSQPFMAPPVAVRVENANVRERREVLIQYEDVFSAWPLATRYLLPDAPAPEGVQLVIDASKPFDATAFASDGGCIPDAVRQAMPLRISEGFRASYCWSEDRRTLLAYLYNCTGHLDCDYTSNLGGRFHRLPRQSLLQLAMQHFPATRLLIEVYDLVRKTILCKEVFSEELSLDLGRTDADVFVLITPYLTDR